MQRKKKRPDWPSKGYKYWAKPMDKLPENALLQARLMREMWNRCVQFFKEETEKRAVFCRGKNPDIIPLEKTYEEAKSKVDLAYKEFNAAKIKFSRKNKEVVESIKESDIDPLKREMYAAGKKMREAINETAKKFKYKSDVEDKTFFKNLTETYKGYGLSENNTEAILQSFIDTRQNFFKGICKPPRFKKEDIFSFTVRYKNGGYKFDEVINKKRVKGTIFWIDTPGERGRTQFYWKFGDDIITFRSILHRPIPEESFIKSVKIAKDNTTGKWSIVFALSLPPVTLPHGDKKFYFTPRWSVDHFNSNLIAGELHTFDGTSEEGVYEPVLFNELNPDDNESGKYILQLVAAVEEQRSFADQAIEGMKVKIEHLLLKLRSFGWNGNLSLCRIGGIKGIQKIFFENTPCHPINDILSEGIQKYYYHMNHSIGIDRRIRKFRDWCYWNFAKRLSEQASTVYLEKVDLKKLGEVNEVSKITQGVESTVRKFKSYVAHYDLYSKIKKKCAEHGVKVVECGFRKESVQ